MNFSKCLAAIVIIASIVLIVEASGPYCRGYGCHPQPASYQPHAPAPQNRAPHGPYHSYAVRPAVYGGPHMYTYRGYARHPKPAPKLAPVKVHMKAAAYSPYSHAPVVAPLTLAIEAPIAHECHGYNCHSAPAAPAAPAQAPAHDSYNSYNPHGYTLHPIKAVLLAPIAAPIKQNAYPATATKSYGDHAEPASYTDSHAALAGPLYHGEAARPASYGAGHYYQALETLKSQDAHNNRKYRSSSSSSSAHHAAAPSSGGY